MKIDLPLASFSVNKAWYGIKHKTEEYKQFERDCLWLLKNVRTVAPEGAIEIYYKFYSPNFSKFDTDNQIKCLQDILQKRKIIKNDNLVFKLIAEKIPSNQHKIEILITPYIKK